MERVNFAELHYLAESAAWRPDRYYTYDLMSQLLRELGRGLSNVGDNRAHRK